MIRTIIFSVALVLAAAILGYQVKQVGGGRETISVKGLAEKPVKADRAEWTLNLQTQGATIADALGETAARETGARQVPRRRPGFEKAALDRFQRIGRA